jgi:hypothetical protein
MTLSRESLLMRLQTAETECALVWPREMLLGCRLCGVKVEYKEGAVIPHMMTCIFHGIRDEQTTEPA